MAARRRLITRRRDLGLSQEDIAAALGVERSTVGRWDSGETAPALWLRPRLAKLLEITRTELGDMIAEADDRPAATGWPDLAENDDMALYRRDLLRMISLAGALLALPAVEDDLADTDEVDGYARLNNHLWQTFSLTSAKATMRAVVGEQLRMLTASLSQPHGPATRRLCALAGDLFQLAGEIHFDASDYTAAAHCYTLAAEASEKAAAFDQWACALTRHAFISVYERKFTDAAPMLEAAAGLALRGDSQLSTRYWVAVVQAETYAGQGNLADCQRALGRAEGVLELHGPVHNGGWLRFDGSRLAEERGTCYATLGRLDLAEAALTDALRQDLSTRRRASVLTDLATIGAQRRDPDQVLVHAAPVLAQARATKSGVITSKLRGLQPKLTPLLANKKIARLNSDINGLIGASAAQ
jgi:transcriptional regulator with XRE-family HTH domain